MWRAILRPRRRGVSLQQPRCVPLLQVFDTLIKNGATVIVIEHDLDVIRAADYIIDMGPGGGEDGGRIVATGTPQDIANNNESVTGKFLGKTAKGERSQ